MWTKYETSKNTGTVRTIKGPVIVSSMLNKQGFENQTALVSILILNEFRKVN